MTDTLYRWVKSTQRNPESKKDIAIRHDDLGPLVGWWEEDQKKWFTDNNEAFLPTSIEWLEPYTPSPGDNQSLEEAAEEYADDWATKLEFKKGSHEYAVCVNDFKAGFVAGEKYQSQIEINNGNQLYRSASEYADNQSYLDGVGVYEKVRDAYAAGLASRPSIDIVDRLREECPIGRGMAWEDGYVAHWNECCDKLFELLNGKK